jgi:phosphotransferase system HPr (HPr) family protein
MIERTVVFRDRYGLHPRSAHRILETLGGTSARATLRSVDGGGSPVDARSMLGLISSGIRSGETIVVAADGPDEERVVEVLSTLLESGVCHPAS